MKKLVSFFAVLTMLFSFAACSGKDSEGENKKTAENNNVANAEFEQDIPTTQENIPTTKKDELAEAKALYASGDLRGAVELLAEFEGNDEADELKEKYKAELLAQLETNLRWNEDDDMSDYRLLSGGEPELYLEHSLEVSIHYNKIKKKFYAPTLIGVFFSTIDQGWVFPTKIRIKGGETILDIPLSSSERENEMEDYGLSEFFVHKLSEEEVESLALILKNDEVKVRYFCNEFGKSNRDFTLNAKQIENMRKIIDFYFVTKL